MSESGDATVYADSEVTVEIVEGIGSFSNNAYIVRPVAGGAGATVIDVPGGFEQVLEALEASQAATHVIVLKDQATSAARRAWRLEGGHLLDDLHQRDLVLARGPRRTGGQRRDLLMSTATRDALDRLAGILTSQYEVVYSRPASLIPPEQIAVRMRRNDLTARGTPVRRTGGERGSAPLRGG